MMTSKRKTYRNAKGQFTKRPDYTAEYIAIAFGFILIAIHAHFGGFVPAVEWVRGLL